MFKQFCKITLGIFNLSVFKFHFLSAISLNKRIFNLYMVFYYKLLQFNFTLYKLLLFFNINFYNILFLVHIFYGLSKFWNCYIIGVMRLVNVAFDRNKIAIYRKKRTTRARCFEARKGGAGL